MSPSEVISIIWLSLLFVSPPLYAVWYCYDSEKHPFEYERMDRVAIIWAMVVIGLGILGLVITQILK
jgi:hypothetical protein